MADKRARKLKVSHRGSFRHVETSAGCSPCATGTPEITRTQLATVNLILFNSSHARTFKNSLTVDEIISAAITLNEFAIHSLYCSCHSLYLKSFIFHVTRFHVTRHSRSSEPYKQTQLKVKHIYWEYLWNLKSNSMSNEEVLNVAQFDELVIFSFQWYKVCVFSRMPAWLIKGYRLDISTS